MQKVSNVASLYEQEREDIQKLMERTAYLENNFVNVTDYAADKKYSKIQL